MEDLAKRFRGEGYTTKQSNWLVRKTKELIEQGLDREGAYEMAKFDYESASSQADYIRAQKSGQMVSESETVTEQENSTVSTIIDRSTRSIFEGDAGGDVGGKRVQGAGGTGNVTTERHLTPDKFGVNEMIDLKRNPGKLINLIKLELGKTLQQIADATGFSVSTIDRVSKGQGNAPDGLLKKLLEYASNVV